jgi:hypothetical protein
MPYGSRLPLEDQGMNAYRRAPIPFAFASICPKCRVHRSQHRNRALLRRLLADEHPIEAFCEVCEEYWPICPRERADIARDIAR